MYVIQFAEWCLCVFSSKKPFHVHTLAHTHTLARSQILCSAPVRVYVFRKVLLF